MYKKSNNFFRSWGLTQHSLPPETMFHSDDKSWNDVSFVDLLFLSFFFFNHSITQVIIPSINQPINQSKCVTELQYLHSSNVALTARHAVK